MQRRGRAQRRACGRKLSTCGETLRTAATTNAEGGGDGFRRVAIGHARNRLPGAGSFSRLDLTRQRRKAKEGRNGRKVGIGHGTGVGVVVVPRPRGGGGVCRGADGCGSAARRVDLHGSAVARRRANPAGDDGGGSRAPGTGRGEVRPGSRKVKSSSRRVRPDFRRVSAGFSSCSRAGRTVSPPLRWRGRPGAPDSRTGGHRSPGALFPDPGWGSRRIGQSEGIRRRRVTPFPALRDGGASMADAVLPQTAPREEGQLALMFGD